MALPDLPSDGITAVTLRRALADREREGIRVEDPFAGDLVFEGPAGAGVGAPAQPAGRGGVAGQGDGDGPAEPAGCEDPVDLGLDGGSSLAGPAACEAGLQFRQLLAGLVQGLVESAGLTLMEAFGVGDDRAALDAERLNDGVVGGETLVAIGVCLPQRAPQTSPCGRRSPTRAVAR